MLKVVIVVLTIVVFLITLALLIRIGFCIDLEERRELVLTVSLFGLIIYSLRKELGDEGGMKYSETGGAAEDFSDEIGEGITVDDSAHLQEILGQWGDESASNEQEGEEKYGDDGSDRDIHISGRGQQAETRHEASSASDKGSEVWAEDHGEKGAYEYDKPDTYIHTTDDETDDETRAETRDETRYEKTSAASDKDSGIRGDTQEGTGYSDSQEEPAQERQGHDKKKKKGEKSLRDLTWRENIGFIYNRRGSVKKYIKWIKRVAGRLLKTVKFENFRLEIRGGTGNYAFTGMLAGWWRGIESFVGNEGVIELNYEPVFSDVSCLSVDCNIRGYTFVVYLIRPVFIGLVTLPYITSLRLFLQYRKLRKGGHDV